jgi:hypothetical protein
MMIIAFEISSQLKFICLILRDIESKNCMYDFVVGFEVLNGTDYD